ncbi:PREDICTED: uncharacterized protein LOC105458403 isoform X2 [Wasmannia auropunctata]|uniref:uncharacterized protein LOC105458403 isoform X2 n=1 Tax=Wasmannia auropunctata TaxID=64793 RepID=UPI0005EE392F|nr:PREDICTED: uncharacterized protein LOC105458403 isoform X2 [Wasmannia auropunctata]
MRALNSRRPRSTASIHRLAPLCFFLLLCVLHARARSVPHDDGGVIADQVHGKISEPVEVSDPEGVNKEDVNPARKSLVGAEVYTEHDADEDEDEDVSHEERNNAAEEVLGEEPEKIQVEAAGDEGSVAKKRRRNDVSLPDKPVSQDGENVAQNIEEKNEGIRRFDAQVESDDTSADQRTIPESITEENPESQGDTVEINVEELHADVKNVNGDEDKAEQEGEKYVDTSSNLEENHEDVASLKQTEEIETVQTEKLAEHNLDEAQAENIEGVNENVRNELRSLQLAQVQETESNQEEHVADEVSNNEEIGDKDLDKNRENRAKVSEKSVEVDAVAAEKDEEIRNQRSGEVKTTQSENLDELSPTTEADLNRFQKWKSQVAFLQEQIKNRTFLQHLREQAIEVLPDIPKFTENQLLDVLKNIVLTRKSPANETYSASLDAAELTENQLEIIKCAEQLVETKQRQSFVENVGECVRGLSVLNCIRIFVWPVVLDNVPESVKQSLDYVPIEINLIDLFQGNRAKSARSWESGVHRPRLLTPEFVVFNILKGALESKVTYDLAPAFIDPTNETLRALLTVGQLQILQMAEKLLPGEIRREYSDRMFSCVRRFEYFSCVKYFAWPMVKQYYPTLPAFPDYQSWYPSIALYPQYPIVPFPSFAGELPEVIEADATRMRKPKPEAVIVNILENTLKEHAKVPPPAVAHSTDSYVALLPPEQLLSIHMAEQLLPIPYRPEFVQKTVKCIQEFNYVTCIKYSTWPTVKQFNPGLSLPDISDWLPDWQLPDVFGYFPTFSLPDFSSFLPPIFGTRPPTTPTPPATPIPPTEKPQSGGSATEGSASRISTSHKNEISFKTSSELENKVTEILTKVRNSLKATPKNSHFVVNENVIVLTTITEKQHNILRLAESLIPPPARAPLVAQVISCLQANNVFLNCTRYIIWPTVALYVPNFPEFPDLSSIQQPSKQEDQTPLKDKDALHQTIKDQQEWNKLQTNSNIKIISRTNIPQNNGPVISVTGTRFVPIFTEHPESVILNILKTVQLSSPNVRDDPSIKITSTQKFDDLFNDQQLTILKIAESLLPDAARPAFVDRMTECVRKGDFLECSRSVLWPSLLEYFPRLPSFPNFGGHLQAANSKATLPLQNLTDPSPFSETDVKVGQHGDATVTITDTRFFPIFSEHPEGVILRILKAVQHSTPGAVTSPVTSRSPQIASYFTEQQGNIVQATESLLPESIRPVFVERMVTCIRESTFLECTRNIAWPTVAQFFPRLPNFPNFGNYLQTLPRTKLDLSSILLRNAYSDNQTSNEKSENTPTTAVETIEDKIESVLKELLSKNSSPRLENSYLDVDNPVIGTLLTAREMNIVRLAERALPDSVRRDYVTNMLECARSNNFIICTEHITWPTLKQFSPSLPNFGELLGQFQIPGAGQIPGISQIPGIGQIPGAGQIPGIGQIPGAGQIPGIGQIPGAGQIPGFGQIPGAGQIPGIGQIPGVGQIPGIGQIPGAGQIPGIGQLPGQIPNLPGFGNPFAERPSLPQFPLPQIPMLPGGIQTGIPQFPGLPSFGSLNYPQYQILSDAPQESKLQEPKPQEPKPQEPKEQVQSKVTHAVKANQISGESRASNTPSVDEQGVVPGYLGQPSDILIDVSKERIHLSELKQSPLSESVLPSASSKKHERRRRSADQLLNSYYETEGEIERASGTAMDSMFPNITESEFLQLLVNISKLAKTLKKEPEEKPKEYFVDTLNYTVRNSLTADQYEIMKLVEDLNEHTANRGLLSQVVQCALSLSFIRCVGIFVWPVITSTVPTLIGLLPLPTLPFIGRSTEIEVQHFFGMSTNDFEKELLMRKESMENTFLEWYKTAVEDKFQVDLGFLKFTGYGNGEVGISFSGFREGRATKIKDNKNLPSILTIISDIMEEVLDQRPDNEKLKKEKEKRERSLDDVQEANFQLLQESDEYAGIKRSMNDDQIITMFLDKIKANATDFADGDVGQFLNVENAHNAFSVLFGTRLNEKFASRLKAFTEEHLKKSNPGKHVKNHSTEELKIIPLKGEMTYKLEKESMESDEDRKREHRAKNEFRSLLDEYSEKLAKKSEISMEKIENSDNENRIKDPESSSEKNTRSELRIQLPRLRDDIISRKITSAAMHLGRALKMKMTHLMPGIGFVITFIIQMALAHARAAASMAGMISNMALASAMFGMIRQSVFGSENPKIKYVYDNDKTGPGITWPHHHRSYYHYEK